MCTRYDYLISKTEVNLYEWFQYRFYGETIVKACIEAGASHVDISGEPQYLEQMQLLYSKAAEEKNIYIVGACGFDSVPADMGTIFLQDNFKGKFIYFILFPW